MSESTINFIAEFDDSAAMDKVKSILENAKNKIKTADDELFLHEVLPEIGETNGIQFDSWWYSQDIEVKDSQLHVELIGSPSGTEEQDIITWVKLAGATQVSGKAVIDGGGDVFTITF